MTTPTTCATCDGAGEVERPATPAEVDAGYELGVAYSPCPSCGPVEHPAKWSANVLAVLSQVRAHYLPEHPPKVLDPFAGVGIARLAEALAPADLTGVELQPQWVDRGPMPRTVVGDATRLPEGWLGTFGAVFTSPCYGNRMADHHDAADPCKACGGRGVVDVVAAADMSTDALQAGCEAPDGAPARPREQRMDPSGSRCPDRPAGPAVGGGAGRPGRYW